MAMADVELLDALGINGSRASLGFEYRKDKGFKANRYGVLKLTTPLASLGKQKSSQSLNGIEYEMTRFVLRDVDIQTGISKKSISPTQLLLNSSTTATTTTGVDVGSNYNINSDNSISLNVSTGVIATTIDQSDLNSSLTNTLEVMAQKDSTDTQYVFLAPGGSFTHLVELQQINLEYAWESLSSDMQANLPANKDDTYALPLAENVVLVGTTTTGIDHNILISDENVSAAMSAIENLDSSVFSQHLADNQGTFDAIVSDANLNELFVEGAINFSDESSEVRVDVPIRLVSPPTTDGLVARVLIGLTSNTFRDRTSAINLEIKAPRLAIPSGTSQGETDAKITDNLNKLHGVLVEGSWDGFTSVADLLQFDRVDKNTSTDAKPSLALPGKSATPTVWNFIQDYNNVSSSTVEYKVPVFSLENIKLPSDALDSLGSYFYKDTENNQINYTGWRS